MPGLSAETREKVDEIIWRYGARIGLNGILDIADEQGVFDAVIFTNAGKLRIVGLTDEEAVKLARAVKARVDAIPI